MSATLEVIEGGMSLSDEIIEVATSQLSEHTKQVEYSPPMSKKKWREFIANVATEGVIHPILVTKGFRVIGNVYHYKAAKELGIESLKVVFEDVAENKIPSYMTNNILQLPEIKPGQRATLVIRLHYKDGGAQGKRTDLSQDWERLNIHEKLAKMAGVSKGSIGNLITVYKRRPDLFERVFSGEYSINKAYTEMKADEEPERVEEEKPIELERKALEALKESESSLPQIDESQPSHSLDNRLIQMRKKALALTVEVLDESEKMHEAKPEVKDSARSQLLTLTRSCVLALGNTAGNDDDAELLAVVHELLNKLSGGN